MASTLPKGGFNLILTDPPYGTLDNLHSWDKAPDWGQIEAVFADLVAPFGQILIFADIHNLAGIKALFGKFLTFRTYHIWRKSGGMPVNEFTPIYDAEFILVFRRKRDKVSKLTFNPYELGEKGDPYQRKSVTHQAKTRGRRKSASSSLNGDRWPRTILTAPAKPHMPQSERTGHPTQKPLSLIRKLIKGYSNPGDSVFDPFAGSGTTLIGAYLENRNATGCELREDYFKEAQARIQLFTSQPTLFDGDNGGGRVKAGVDITQG